jgi:hypothetical protein
MASLFVAVAVSGLPACDAQPKPLSASDAHYWLKRTCDLEFNGGLVVVDGATSFSTAPHGVANFTSGTVRIPRGAASVALGGLRGNHLLRSVPGKQGIDAFESDPSAGEHRTCWLDASKETVFFEYRD